VTDRNEYAPRFSPDGRWIAYVSDEAGQPNVYVRAYPPTERSVVRVVTSDGGYEPRWSPDGTTLYYLSASGKLMAAEISLDRDAQVVGRRELFDFPFRFQYGRAFYDVDPQSGRLVGVVSESRDVRDLQVDVVQNWFEELKRLVPSG